jgi:hypothetical protein
VVRNGIPTPSYRFTVQVEADYYKTSLKA